MRGLRKLTPEYLAAQLAGSQRLEGIRVSAEDEHLMAEVISGNASEEELIRAIKRRYQPALKVIR